MKAADRSVAELEALNQALDSQRGHVLGILEGLSDQDLRRPVLPSGWSCLELVRHLTVDVELRHIVIHVLTEVACHAGHLDAARELIDGTTWLS
jgi:hypothetical protein